MRIGGGGISDSVERGRECEAVTVVWKRGRRPSQILPTHTAVVGLNKDPI